ncbi:MAG: pyridoxal-phosphate dependent enzyme [Bacteriovoracia bacterium]
MLEKSAVQKSVFDNIIQTIGNTPIVKLNKVAKGCVANVYAKLEYMNPGGSIKDRIGYWLIEDAEKRGVLKPGGTIVEGTSGNTGVGLAIASAIKGYQCVFVLPDKMSEEKIRALRAFGAKVVVTPTDVEFEDPRSYYQVSRRLAKETPNAIYVNQYDNLANRDCHLNTTGPEILRQMPDLDYMVAGIGTGGTVCGIGMHFRDAKSKAKVVAVDPVGSLVYNYFKTGKMTPAFSYKIEGIGEDFIPKNYDLSVVHDMVQVEDKESFLMARELLLKEGIYSGISSGSAVVGALKWVQAQGEKMKGKNVLVILPDSGNRYLSKLYNDDWMREAGFLDAPSLGTVADILRVALPAGQPAAGGSIVMGKPTDKVSAIVQMMKDKGISQLPISDGDGWIKGIVTEGNLLRALYSGKAKSNDNVETLMESSIEFVKPTDSVERISQLVTAGKTPLVTDPNKSNQLIAILTKIDLVTYLSSRK